MTAKANTWKGRPIRISHFGELPTSSYSKDAPREGLFHPIGAGGRLQTNVYWYAEGRIVGYATQYPDGRLFVQVDYRHTRRGIATALLRALASACDGGVIALRPREPIAPNVLPLIQKLEAEGAIRA